jgi:L-2,4-diaminobutyrate transaminase
MAEAALANLDILEEDNLLSSAGEMGTYLNTTLQKAFADLPITAEVRGLGLVAAVEFAQPTSEGWRKFDPKLTVAARIVRAALDDGVIARALPNGDAVSFSPPFIVTHEEIDLAISTIRRAAEQTYRALKAEGQLTTTAA